MTPRFYATVLDHGDARRRDLLGRAASAGLLVLEMHGIAVAVPRSTRCMPFPDRSGVVLGTLLDREGGKTDEVGSGMALATADTDGRFIVDHRWGDYIAIWRHPRRSSWHLLRDPAGATMALLGHDAERVVAFSDLEFAMMLGWGPRPAIDWAGMAYGMCYEGLHADRTGIRGVTEVVPGHIADLSAGGQRSCWTPGRFAARRDQPHGTSVDLRRAVDMCVGARAVAGSVVELSGGLDSSIVAASMSRQASATALTIYTPGQDGDERDYATCMADHCGFPIRHLALENIDLLAGCARATVRPTGRSYLSGVDGLMADAIRSLGASTSLTGAGGDAVFRRSGSPLAILDAFLAAGGSVARSTAIALAEITGRSVGRALTATVPATFHALRGGRRPRPSVLPSLAERCPEFTGHPMLEHADRALPGAFTHLALIAATQSMQQTIGRGEGVSLVMPLLAQPVLEASLAIPSWRWIEGGVDRAAARAAFGDVLPDRIRHRRTKGRLETLLVRSVQRQQADIRSLLMEGLLARENLLDRHRLEARLFAANPDSASTIELLTLVDAELWARRINALEPSALR